MGQEIQTVHHFSHWVQQKFQKEVSIERVQQVTACSENNDLVYPVVYEGKWLSQVRIKNGQYLDRFSQHQISHFIDLQLAPHMYKQLLELELHNLRSVAEDGFQSDGLYLFGGENESEEKYYEELSRKPQYESHKEPFTICLYGKDTFRHRKIANEIHHLFGHRWALMNYQDLSSNLTSVDQIFELGSVTLYVDQVHRLEQREIDLINQFLIRKYGDFKPRTETPLFVLSSEDSEDFKGVLNSTVLEIDGDSCFRTENWPLKTEQIRDILDLLLS
jgi:hypothetical protein